LKDQEIADVLTYVRSHFGNKAAPITVMQVTKIRQEVKK
jgi:mono/diheme cytochrome c family protein